MRDNQEEAVHLNDSVVGFSIFIARGCGFALQIGYIHGVDIHLQPQPALVQALKASHACAGLVRDTIRRCPYDSM